MWPATGETTCEADVLRGFYNVVLDGTRTTGCGAGLNAEVLATGARFLQVSVDGVPLLPRLRVGAVPLAAIATRSIDTVALRTELAAAGGR